MEASCTATFVSPRTLLTAAHCVDEGSLTVVRTGPAAGKSSTTRFIHDGWGTRWDGGGDLALVVFPQDLTQSYYSVNLDPAQTRSGLPLSLIGYGMTDDNNYNSGGKKTFGSNVITSLRGIGVTFAVAGRVNGPGTGEEASLSNGDSGGPALAGGSTSDLNLLVLGVASTKDVGLSRGKHLGNYTNLSHTLHAQWLRKMAAQGVPIAGINLANGNPGGTVGAPAATPAPTAAPVPAPAPLSGVPLNLAFNPRRGDMLSYVGGSLVSFLLTHGYQLAGKAGCAYDQSARAAGAVPLRNFSNGVDTLQAATPAGAQGARRSGYTETGVLGYVMPGAAPGLVPLKLYYSPARRDGFTFSSPEWEQAAQQSGYTFIRIEGYVPPDC
jgi:hypothetical protein